MRSHSQAYKIFDYHYLNNFDKLCSNIAFFHIFIYLQIKMIRDFHMSL